MYTIQWYLRSFIYCFWVSSITGRPHHKWWLLSRGTIEKWNLIQELVIIGPDISTSRPHSLFAWVVYGFTRRFCGRILLQKHASLRLHHAASNALETGLMWKTWWCLSNFEAQHFVPSVMAYHKLRAAQPVIIRIERDDLSMSKLGFQHNSAVINHEHRFVSKGSCSPTLGILSAQPSSTQAASAVQAVVAGRARVPLTSQSPRVLYCSHLAMLGFLEWCLFGSPVPAKKKKHIRVAIPPDSHDSQDWWKVKLPDNR